MLGIEIWSPREGLQRFDNHANKLINYIRYWQASGISLKISERGPRSGCSSLPARASTVEEKYRMFIVLSKRGGSTPGDVRHT